MLYFKNHQTYLNTSASNRTRKKKLRKKKIIERSETHAINEIRDGEPIATCTTKRQHSSFSYAIKREDMRYFSNLNKCK